MITNRTAEGVGRAHELAKTISQVSGISQKEILGRRRIPPVVQARHHLFVNLWREGYSIAEIGRILHRDHTTVRSGMRRVMGVEEYDHEVSERYPGKPFLRESRRMARLQKQSGTVAA
jgi:chromosomal replication initiation ATPase DnaA